MNKIMEIFTSIQGEGSLQCTNMMLIRWFGCNLACPWCDEPKHVDKGLVQNYSDEELVNLATAAQVKWVCLTGGEITLHDLNPLIKKFQKAGIKVQAESNGHMPLNIMEADHKTCSPKDSKGNIPSKLSGHWTDVKLVVKVGDDARHWIPLYKDTCENLFVQPENHKDTINWDNMDYALSLIEEFPFLGLSPQYHKLLGVE